MRKIFKILHKWLSIPVGLIMTIVCLSGAILVFQEEILEIANPHHYFVEEVKGEPIPLNELIPMVNSQLDSSSVANVKITSDPRRTYTMTQKDGFRISIFVDQYTGKVTGYYSFRDHPFFTVMSLHRWLMDGTHTWGKYIVGWCTLIFGIILITGMVIWFPREFKKSRFKIQFRKGKKRLWHDLHNVLGAYACLVLLLCTLSGLMWSFEWYRNGVFKIFGAELPKEQSRGHGGGGGRGGADGKKEQKMNIAYWQDIYENLKTANPDYDYIRVQDGSAVVHLKSAPTSRATDQYNFDKNTGEITKTVLYADQPKTTKIWGWMYALHVGNYWGIWSKIFTCVFALIGASLPITGYYIFFVKRKGKRRRKKKTIKA